jgi:hypothetical protein
MSKVEKVRLIENIVIQSPGFKNIITRINECHERSKYTSEPRCLFITGETGYGKTTIGKFYTKDYPRVVNDDGAIIPVLRSTISSPATIKSMGTWLLRDLGDPMPDRGTTTSITMRLCKLIKECRVELLILDEFQHLIDKDTEKVIKSSADWLKNILNDTGVPMVLMGMPWSVDILSANDQLQRRFSAKMELKAFGWSTEAEQKEFKTFLILLENGLPLPKPSNLYSGQMPFRLFCATRGILSNIKNLISKTAEKAIEKGFENITMDLLALAYDEELALNVVGNTNPFRTDVESLKVPAAPIPAEPVRGCGGSRHRSRPKGTGKPKGNISTALHR